jgi:hypothetical protein
VLAEVPVPPFATGKTPVTLDSSLTCWNVGDEDKPLLIKTESAITPDAPEIWPPAPVTSALKFPANGVAALVVRVAWSIAGVLIVGVLITGETIVGDVSRTIAPVPVLKVVPAPPFETGKTPVTLDSSLTCWNVGEEDKPLLIKTESAITPDAPEIWPPAPVTSALKLPANGTVTAEVRFAWSMEGVLIVGEVFKTTDPVPVLVVVPVPPFTTGSIPVKTGSWKEGAAEPLEVSICPDVPVIPIRFFPVELEITAAFGITEIAVPDSGFKPELVFVLLIAPAEFFIYLNAHNV